MEASLSIRGGLVSLGAFVGAMISMTGGALACPHGQSKGALGWCYPNIGGTVGQTFEAAKKGDINTLAKGIGDLAIAGTCPVCALAGQALLKKDDRALVSTIVGRGLILSAVGVPPVFIVADASATTASAIQLHGQPAPPIPIPTAASRGRKIFKILTSAACIVQSDDGGTAIGFVTAPSAVDAATGMPATYPALDLVKGDVIHVTASPCTESEGVQGSRVLTDADVVYEQSQIVPGPPERMKFFIMGKAAS